MSETEKTIPPVTPKGWQHINPPTYAKPKVGQCYISTGGSAYECDSLDEVATRADNGRRWIIEREDAPRTAPDGETWVTMRLRDLNRIEQERDSFRETVNEVRTALGCPDDVAIDLHCLDMMRKAKEQEATIAGLQKNLERVARLHECSSLKSRSDAWGKVVDHCTAIGIDWEMPDTGIDAVLAFITDLHSKAKTAEEARNEGVLEQCQETIKNLRQAADQVEAQCNHYRQAQKLRSAA